MLCITIRIKWDDISCRKDFHVKALEAEIDPHLGGGITWASRLLLTQVLLTVKNGGAWRGHGGPRRTWYRTYGFQNIEATLNSIEKVFRFVIAIIKANVLLALTGALHATLIQISKSKYQ